MGPDSSQEVLEVQDATFIEISNLNPFTSYCFKVSAKTKAGSGPDTSKRFKTPEGGESDYHCDTTIESSLSILAHLLI